MGIIKRLLGREDSGQSRNVGSIARDNAARTQAAGRQTKAQRAKAAQSQRIAKAKKEWGK